jgi:DNA replication protein DnaC
LARAQEIRDLEMQMASAREREQILAKRPEGCWCFGAGGAGPVIALPDGGLLFSRYCDACDAGRDARRDGVALQAALRRETVAGEEYEARRRREQRAATLLARARIPHEARDWTFETLPPRPHLQAALDAALGMAPRTYRGLYVFGGPGLMKTGLAISVMRRWIDAGVPSLFVHERDLLSEAKRDFRIDHEPEDTLVARAMRIPLLVYDDLGTGRATSFACDLIAGLLCHRFENRERCATIITSNLNAIAAINRLTGDDGDDVAFDRLSDRIPVMCQIEEADGEIGSTERLHLGFELP